MKLFNVIIKVHIEAKTAKEVKKRIDKLFGDKEGISAYHSKVNNVNCCHLFDKM